MEHEVVRPLKTYISDHTTVKMCQRIIGSIDLLKSCCAAYKSQESFNVHHTVRHSVKRYLKGLNFELNYTQLKFRQKTVEKN